MTFDCVLLKANYVYSNGHVFSREVIEQALAKYQEHINQNRAFGMFRPEGPYQETSIDLTKVSHELTAIRWEDDQLIGTFRVLDTPAGKEVKKLMLNQTKTIYRGVGTTEGGVVKEFEILSFDLDPQSFNW